MTGLYTQRNPLVTPFSVVGLHMIERKDALIGGANVELTNRMTLARRPGFTKWDPNQLGASEIPRVFVSDRDTSNPAVVRVYADFTTSIKSSQGSGWTLVFTPSGGAAQCHFQRVGKALYMANGSDAKKVVDGVSGVSNWGIAAPVTAPTLSFPAGSLTLTSGRAYVYTYVNSATGHESTASPASASTGPITSKNITVQGTQSTDPQVNKINIYSTKDGGSTFFFNAQIANTASWSYTDSTPDASLNTLQTAPINHINDPPPQGLANICFWSGRMWGSAGNILYYNAGPDALNGVPEECWPPANTFTFPLKIIKVQPTSQALIVFTAETSYAIAGLDASTFYAQEWIHGLGVLSPNCVASDGDSLYVYSTQRQLFSIGGSGSGEIGFSIADTILSTFDPSASYVTVHRAGSQDVALYMGDGSSKIARYSLPLSGWSTLYSPVMGCGALRSVETSPGNYQLLAGQPSAQGFVFARNPSVFTDNGTAYPASVTIGTLVLAPPGFMGEVEAILTETTAAGSQPSVSVMPDEISATFTALPVAVNEPPEFPASTTLAANRYYWRSAQTPLPAFVRNLQVQLSWPAEAAQNELLGFGIMPPELQTNVQQQ